MKRKGALTAGEIEATVTSAERFAKQKGIEDKDSLAFRLLLEEILLIYSEAAGPETLFNLRMRTASDAVNVTLSVCSSSFDATTSESMLLQQILRKSGLAVSWEYQGGCNRVSFHLPLYNSARRNVKFVWSYTSRYKGRFFLAVGAQWVNVAMNIIVPVLSARVIVAYTDSAFEQILYTALMLLIVSIFSNLSLFLCNTQYNIVYTRILSEIERDLAEQVLNIRNSCMEQKGGGLFIQRLTADTLTLATGFNTVSDYVSQIFRYIGILVAMLIVSPPIFLVATVLLAAQITIELIRTRVMTADDRISRQAGERFTGFVSEMIHGMNDVKVLNCEEAFQKELTKRIEATNYSRMHMLLRTWKYKLSRWGIANTGTFAFICLLGLLITRGRMAPAIALVLYNYYSEIGGSAVLLLGQLLEFVREFNLSAERVCALLNSPEFPKETFGHNHLEDVQGELRFEHVRFQYESSDLRYPSGPVLDDMSFEIPAGSNVALVGRSGCGKSTVFRLLCKLNEASEGTVYLDGTDIRELDKESIRGNLTLVSQHPYVFHMTIRENLQMVKPGLTEEEMREVCEKVCIAEDISRMPQGYDTLVGEGGINLSGGQLQRLALARCLLRNYRVILLDEATSALDNKTQMQIQQAMRNLRGNRTVVMIAHRLSTVVDADKIMFMQDGRILDEGTHTELLARCDAYRELYEAEASMERLADVEAKEQDA